MSPWKCAIAGLLCALLLFAATPASPGRDAYERANALFAAGKFPEALAATEEALRLEPKLVPALTLKAKLAMAGGRHDVARKCLEQALEIDPRAAYAQFLYGLVAYLGNDLEAALPRFRKARQLSPSDPRAALYLGLTVESLGQPAQAMSLYEEAVRLERSTGEVHAETLLPGAKLLLLLGRLEESERWIREAVKASPNSRDVHFELARVLLKKGDAGQAAAQGEIALTLSDGVVTDAAIHYLLIRAWQQNGRPDRAAMHANVMRAQETPVGSAVKR
ncbi:Tetratricopeptide TPR_2 repeat protein [Candidatus Sulfopaludibacter sp. SbA6]|nr:Tetratricopeptide TPR_2 repeat protein [Candidatus Sulfopaludibacter sp. SbA6]